jgi:hypothetical protein
MSKEFPGTLSRLIEALNHPKDKWYDGYDIGYDNATNLARINAGFDTLDL